MLNERLSFRKIFENYDTSPLWKMYVQNYVSEGVAPPRVRRDQKTFFFKFKFFFKNFHQTFFSGPERRNPFQIYIFK